MSNFSAPKLYDQIDQCLLVDRHPLRTSLRGIIAAKKKGNDIQARLDALLIRIEKSQNYLQQRQLNKPTLIYPDTLPVVEQKEAIIAAIKSHQVVVVCADTGSGKTTQLPKLCLEAGRGVSGLIGHTQPRRIAARSVAARIATEMQTELGAAVGFKVRFSDHVSDQTYVKLMTDGILLSEIQNDPWLNAYDTLIIDEAHERSLNIDFILGYLKQLLQKRKDLKVVITSATIDPQRFSDHFNQAPIILAEGRSYPVEVRYRPIIEADNDTERDEKEAFFEACEELSLEGAGDILCFFPGERQIREHLEYINKRKLSHKFLRSTEILPLFARLSTAEQNKIFNRGKTQRIILATNVAETSLTVPGIRYVIDTGTARISRYSVRSKVQRLPIEAVSQASANQRKGRCGREAPGICIRLYGEDDFELRPEFTAPEILRTNLAAVILRMESLRLGRVDSFPFVEAPESKFINDGYKLLHELGAVDNKNKLTAQGRVLAKFPVDPKLARMLIEARKEGSLEDVLTLVAALSVQDPRERPQDKRQAADEMHAEFHDEKSDFMSLLNLWAFYQTQSDRLSQSQLRKMCKQRYINYIRMREWRDVRHQLRDMLRQQKWKWSETTAEYDALHRAILSGLLGNIAVKDDRGEYLATRNRRLRVAPGTPLANKGPKWMMAAEITETSRLYARHVAKIDVEWIEGLSLHLIKRSHFDPRWHQKHAQVGAYEKGMLYGLIIYPKKRVNYGPIDPVVSREIFIRMALVEGQYKTRAGFFSHNQALLEDVEALENKTRRRDILVSPEQLYDFYESLVPEGIYSGAQFEQWLKSLSDSESKALYFDEMMLKQREADDITDNDYPSFLEFAGIALPVSYHFSPGSEEDGVTLSVPLGLLNRVSEARCSYLVPGMLAEKVTLLIKSLPKFLRKNFIPAPDYAKACVEVITASDKPLLEALGLQLKRMTGIEVGIDEWQPKALPDHMRMRFELLDHEGKKIDSGRSLTQLHLRHGDRIQEGLSQHNENEFERDNLTDWNFGDLPDTIEIQQSGISLHGFPALVSDSEGVHLRILASRIQADAATKQGIRALYKNLLKEELKYLRRKLPNIQQITLMFAPFGNKAMITEDIVEASIDQLFVAPFDSPKTREAFYAPMNQNRADLVAYAGKVSETVCNALEAHRSLARRFKKNMPLSWIEPVADIKDQIAHLFYAGFVFNTPPKALARYVVYLNAIERRLITAEQKPEKDRQRRSELLPVWESFKQLSLPKVNGSDYQTKYQIVRWQFEELRVSLFAQDLGTSHKVSVTRLENAIKELKTLQRQEKVQSA